MKQFCWIYPLLCISSSLAAKPFSGVPAQDMSKLFKYGFRVNLHKIPMIERHIPTNVSWTEFRNVTKLIASAAYDIHTAYWKGGKVVIKTLRSANMRSGSPTEMEKEISILSRLEHPNIIKLLGSGYSPHRFQILEYLGGGTLHKVLKDRVSYPPNKKSSVVELLPQNRMMEYGVKLADALHYMHEGWHPSIRIFHRDLKPHNIGLTISGELKVFDFGMAELIRKTADDNVLFPLSVAPENGKALGTWPYTSPEILRREYYNHKSDIYCYAVILYYIIVGKHPMRKFRDHLELKKNVGVYDGWRPKPEHMWPDDLIHLFAQIWNNDIYVRPSLGEVSERLKYINKTYPDIWTREVKRPRSGVIEFV